MGEFFRNRCAVRPAGYLLSFFCGLAAGILLVQTQKSTALTGIFGEYFLNQYANLRIDPAKLLSYIGWYRCGHYFLAVCWGAAAAAPTALCALVFFLGLSWGTAVSISAVCLGLKGVLICAAGIFPQFVFYLPAFGWILFWTMCGGRNRKRYLVLAAAGFLFLLFGIGAEAVVNPLILQQILRKIS